MKAHIVIFGIFVVSGLIGSFWNPAQLYFTVLPCAVLGIVSIKEYRDEKRKKSKLNDKTL